MNFFRTSVSATQTQPSMERSTTSASTRSTSSRTSNMSGGYEEAESQIEEEEKVVMKEEKVYVAVGKNVKDSKANLLWVLQNVPREKKIVILHIHRPAKTIPLMGGYFPADQLDEHEVATFRQIEFRTMNKTILKYLTICSRVKVRADKLITEMGDVAEGIVMLIAQHGITELVVGAAADKYYSKKMKVPTSKTALAVQEQADPSCKIQFVCKGHLICTRMSVRNRLVDQLNPKLIVLELWVLIPMTPPELKSFKTELIWIAVSWEAAPNGYDATRSHTASSNSLSNHYENLNSRSLPPHEAFMHGSRLTSFDSHEEPTAVPSPDEALGNTTAPGKFVIDLLDRVPRKTYQGSNHSFHSVGVKDDSSMDSEPELKCMENKGNLSNAALIHESNADQQFSSLHHYLKDVGANNEMYKDFQTILTEAEKLRHEALQEPHGHQKSENDLYESSQSVKVTDTSHGKEMMQRKQAGEMWVRETLEMEDIRRERDETYKELQKEHEQRVHLELQVINLNRTIKDLQEKLSEAHCLLFSLEREQEELQSERDNAVKKADQLRQKLKALEISHRGTDNFSEFSYSELEEATNNFNESLKIGEGGYGSVYKGLLRHRTVAIKLLNPQGMQGKTEFHKEMDVLSKVRHPNLVTLIGACSEAWALVYEFLPNGSLEDRLACKDNTPPLTWQSRFRIAAEICSALIFLHSNKPLTVIHGDLKPANILLDANFVSRVGDFGICRLLESNANTILFRCTHPMGTFVYMDPEFLASGELRPCSDVYSFGIIILRLLTGKPALGLINEVHDALDEGHIEVILDASAGRWPYEQAKKLAELGLKCCEIKRKNRPDLASEAWNVLEPLMKIA
ncbi:U-box domain-containing protein 33-like [Typha latifolia]|uniref:U-box domain-containing protein 33-like n=1 Tax=Typha latifolia TaxID=4733 RepID=UPI003C304B35